MKKLITALWLLIITTNITVAQNEISKMTWIIPDTSKIEFTRGWNEVLNTRYLEYKKENVEIRHTPGIALEILVTIKDETFKFIGVSLGISFPTIYVGKTNKDSLGNHWGKEIPGSKNIKEAPPKIMNIYKKAIESL